MSRPWPLRSYHTLRLPSDSHDHKRDCVAVIQDGFLSLCLMNELAVQQKDDVPFIDPRQ
jgi:hypothetical protein